MSSIWFQENDKHIATNPLNQSLTTEVAVIGGGLCGILTAYKLQKLGVKVILLTKGNIGEGQSGNNTGKITAQHGLIYHTLIQTFGKDLARQYAQGNLDAVAQYKDIIEKENISCDFEEKPSFLYSEEDYNELLQEWKALCSLEINTSFQRTGNLPFPVKGLIRWEHQAQCNPVKFMISLSENSEIYTNSYVTEVKEHSLQVNGNTITADHIVFACHVPWKGTYFPRLYQSRAYVVAVEQGSPLDGMYIGTKEDSLSLRNYKNYTLLCGKDHPSGKNHLGGRYAELEGISQIFWNQSKLVTKWSAQDGMTIDSVPYIGRFSPLHRNWYVATGFGKWGLTTSMVAANIISSLICQKNYPYSDIFSPNRLPMVAIPNLLQLGKNTSVECSKELFAFPRTTKERLPKEHGGIVETENGKVGLYHDKQGNYHQVNSRCPHLGGQLSWNPDTKTWDCPCHGSRFNHKGKLLDGPATEDIT